MANEVPGSILQSEIVVNLVHGVLIQVESAVGQLISHQPILVR